jgi:RNA polymerase sigma-70 factor (ECF subfamily)
VDSPRTATVEAFRRGDSRAAEQVLGYAYALALRTAAAVLLSRREAADVAQEVALLVWRHRRRLRDPERLDAWVCRITVRVARRALAASRRREGRERALVDDVGIEALDPIGRLAARGELRDALARLPERQRLALGLRYVADLSEREVARALICRPGTAAALLSRARATLREAPELAEWKPNGEEDDDARHAAPAR